MNRNLRVKNKTPVSVLAMLVRRGIVTTNSADADECCGWERDADGFCQHRPHHPIYVRLTDEPLN